MLRNKTGMRVLIVAATKKEVGNLISENSFLQQKNCFVFKSDNLHIDLVITGVGMVATAFLTTKFLSENKYDFAINIGICGSYKRSLEIGEVVFVSEDSAPEIGKIENESFIPIFDMGLVDENDFPFENGFIKNQEFNFLKAKNVKGATVSIIDNDRYLSGYINHKADIETMEGFAFMYVAKTLQVPFAQIRAVSNFVAKRDEAEWNIPLATANLSAFTWDFVNSLNKF